MIEDFQRELEELEREIRDLKTAQIKPSNSQFYRESATLPAGDWYGAHYWTINYEDVDDDTAPITYTNSLDGICLQPYDSATNTQRLEWYAEWGSYASDQIFPIFSSRPIASVTFNG